MSGTSDIPDLARASSVHELVLWYRAAFHGHLLMGRAIGSFAPLIAPLDQKWRAVSASYVLVMQAQEWARRLDDLGAPQPEVGSAPEAVASMAADLCRLDWSDALTECARYVTAWRDEMRRAELLGSALQYDEARIVARAEKQFADLLTRLVGDESNSRCEPVPLRPGHFAPNDARTTPTGTPPLPVPTVTSRAYPPPPDSRPPFFLSAESREQANALHHTLQIEFIACDIPLRNLAEYEDMPLEFYVDMVRQSHDEMRHCWLLEHCLNRMGYAVGNFEFRLPDRFDLLIQEGLVYRLVLLSRTGESEAIETLTAVIPKLEAAGRGEIARMWDYVRADEIRHANRSNKWLRHLVGDDDQAVCEATRTSLDCYNRAIEGGSHDLSPREVDYLRSPGLPIDPIMRAHAGFTATEIAIMSEVRGTTDQSSASLGLSATMTGFAQGDPAS